MSADNTDYAATLEQLKQFLGDEFLRYILDSPAGLRPQDIAESRPKTEVLQVLTQWTTPKAGGVPDEFSDYVEATNLSRYVPAVGTSVVNYLRLSAGGSVAEVGGSQDPVVDALVKIARDIWPIYLLKPRGSGPRTFWMTSPIGVFGHPVLKQAVDAVLGDPALRKLFPFPPAGEDGEGAFPGVGYTSLLVTNGASGSLQLVSLIPNLISNGVFRLLMRGQELSLEHLALEISAVVSALRRLAGGEEVGVPALIGFAGVQMPAGAKLVLPTGCLRAATATDKELFFASSNSVGTVFETTFPTRIYSITENTFTGDETDLAIFSRFTSRITETQRAFGHSVDLVRLTLLLASPPGTPWLAREVARYVVDLTSHGGSSSWDPGPVGVPSHELPAVAHEDVLEWHSVITNRHHPSLDIGLRRLLSAVTMRSDPIDGFVDAVVCWENLFGVETETTFRVTASIAKLLRPRSPADRESLQKELKEIYSRRSRIVHGGPEPSAEETAKLRMRAIEIAEDCLRAFYRDRYDLIGLSSSARGTKLLLE